MGVNNFWARTITGLSMVFVLFAALYFNHWIFAGLIFIVLALALIEFYKLFSTDSIQPQKVYGIVSGILLYIANIYFCFLAPATESLAFTGVLPLLLSIPLFFCSFIVEIYRRKPNPLINIAVTNLGIFYIALPLSFLNCMNGDEVFRFLHLPAFLMGYLMITWLFDTTAYLFGKQFGKHKLFERISPKKTWEGTIAGAIVAFAAAVCISFIVPEILLTDWLMVTIIVLVFGSYGDLAESLFKRSLSVKDSGSVLPGHGGILDRFDTILLSAPFVFLYFIVRGSI